MVRMRLVAVARDARCHTGAIAVAADDTQETTKKKMLRWEVKVS